MINDEKIKEKNYEKNTQRLFFLHLKKRKKKNKRKKSIKLVSKRLATWTSSYQLRDDKQKASSSRGDSSHHRTNTNHKT